MKPEDVVSLSKKQFGREASKYVDSVVHSSESDLQFVRDFIDPQKNWSVLDIATGTGHLALTLAPFVNKVLATDITPEMLQEADNLVESRNITNLSTSEVDVHSIPYENEYFDLVTSRIAPHHFHDISLAISEMTRVCKSGGYIFIEDTVAPEDTQAAKIFNKIEVLRDPSHVRDLSPSQWIELLQEHGNTLKKSTTRQKDWPLKWWTERMSTPKEQVKEIISILEEIYEDYKDLINIKRSKDYTAELSLDKKIVSWSIHPKNGYFLVQKQ